MKVFDESDLCGKHCPEYNSLPSPDSGTLYAFCETHEVWYWTAVGYLTETEDSLTRRVPYYQWVEMPLRKVPKEIRNSV